MKSTYICFVNTKTGATNFLKSLRRLTPDEIVGGRVFFVYNGETKDLAEELKNQAIMFPTNARDICLEKDIYSKLNSEEIIIFWDETVILNPDSIMALTNDLRRKKDTGLVTGAKVGGEMYYLVDDIYNPTGTSKVDGKGLLKIDIAEPYLIVCRGKVFLDLYNSPKEYYGLNLRRLGYQNYINTNIQISTEGIDE